MGQSREYAEVLLEMAEAVRCRGGRLSWQGVGMYGAGSLQQRIDRILNGDAARAIPRRHKALVAVGCAAAIFFGAACRQAASPDATGTATSAARILDSKESYRLGGFYAAILMKLPEAFMTRELGTPQDYGAYAAEIRKRLERSQDLTLLLETSSRLLAWGRIRQKAVPPDFDLFAFGKTLVQRALQFDPKSAWAHQLLTVAADQELLGRLPESVLQGPVESRHQAIQTLPDGDRFRELTILAIEAGDVGFRADHVRHDATEAKAAWQQAGGYAREALDIAPKAQSHPDYGTAFFKANMMLGLEAIHGDDPKTANSYLLKAAEAPVTDALKYPVDNTRPWGNMHFPTTLAAALLKAGQRDAVVEFLERYARITVAGRDQWLEDIALIRQGKLPSWAGMRW
jgi:hypothetical protein